MAVVKTEVPVSVVDVSLDSNMASDAEIAGVIRVVEMLLPFVVWHDIPILPESGCHPVLPLGGFVLACC
jgi:hypothetical protein